MTLPLKWFDLLPGAGETGDPVLDLLREHSLAGGEVRRLLAALGAAWGRPVRLSWPGDPDRGFDETWIAAVVRAVRRGDDASYRFLLSRRLPPEAAAEAHFLIQRVALSL